MACFVFLCMSVENKNKNTEEFFVEKNVSDLDSILNKDETSDKSYFTHKQFRQRQNLALVIVSVVGFLVLVAGIYNVNGILFVPLPITGEEHTVDLEQIAKEKAAIAAESPEVLKKQDTDEDGLSDFDEIYIYDTSAYLADSDSDGYDDLEEVEKLMDPNCPEGQTCFEGFQPGTEEGQSVASGSGGAQVVADVMEVSADDLRSIIVQSGQATEEQLAAIDDTTILDLYQDMLEKNPALKEQMIQYKKAQAGESTDGSTAEVVNPIAQPNATSVGDAASKLKQKTPQEIRVLLVEQGFSELELNQIDDQTLVEVYHEALDEAQNSYEKVE